MNGRWIIMLLCLGCAAISSKAAVFTMADANSTATVDATGGAGMYDWKINGVDNLGLQWFWYRIGNSGPESKVSALPLTYSKLTDTNFDGDADTLFLRYGSSPSPLKIELTFVLTGGAAGDGSSDIGETIAITNTSGAAMTLHFFECVDIHLNGSIISDSATIANGNTAIQTRGPVWVSETVVTPRPNHYEVNTATALLDRLNDALATTLSDSAGPVGPGDLAWAFQWDFTLAKGASVLINKDKQVVPEPCTLSLLALGGLALIRRRK